MGKIKMQIYKHKDYQEFTLSSNYCENFTGFVVSNADLKVKMVSLMCLYKKCGYVFPIPLTEVISQFLHFIWNGDKDI